MDSIQSRMDSINLYKNVLYLASGIFEKEEDKSIFKMDTKYGDKLQSCEKDIKIINVERLIYHALLKKLDGVDNRELFPRLLAKYDELMVDSQDISNNMVLNGIVAEGEYLEFCRECVHQREYIKRMCNYGENIVNIV
nr:MAG: hypothetical protein [Lake Baikal virophage 8]